MEAGRHTYIRTSTVFSHKYLCTRYRRHRQDTQQETLSLSHPKRCRLCVLVACLYLTPCNHGWVSFIILVAPAQKINCFREVETGFDFSRYTTNEQNCNNRGKLKQRNKNSGTVYTTRTTIYDSFHIHLHIMLSKQSRRYQNQTN